MNEIDNNGTDGSEELTEKDIGDFLETNTYAEDSREAETDETADTESISAVQSDEERHRNAEIRRRMERERFEKAAQERVDAAYKAAFGGQVNPFTGKSIENEKDYNEYISARNAQTMQDAGIPADTLNSIISEHPTVKRAEEIMRIAEDSRREAERKKGELELESEIRRISALDPDIKTARDIAESPNANVFNDYLMRGLSLFDAYRLANMDKLTKINNERTRQQTLNSIGTKQHLVPHTDAGSSQHLSEVPRDTAEIYRQLFPEMTADEIRRDYNKRRK